uniref:Uncharacterized protein n=1 Tax=Arundo donax TaxID=35708 RepID=A0A0A9DZE7_ARUDO
MYWLQKPFLILTKLVRNLAGLTLVATVRRLKFHGCQLGKNNLNMLRSRFANSGCSLSSWQK